MRFAAIAVCIFLFSACAAHHPGAATNYDLADVAIGRQDWEAAYRFLEDSFVNTQPELKAKAIEITRQHPQILIAGANTFSRESISKTLAQAGVGHGADIERKRIERYKVVATLSAYEIAKSNVESVAIMMEHEQKEQQLLIDQTRFEKERQQAELRADKDRSKRQTMIALAEAAQKSRVVCQSRAECEKAFSLTQIYVSEKSDMKIQVATETIIETFNPTESMKIGLKAIKIPRRADSSEIVLTANCRDEDRESFKDICDKKLLSIYHGYPAFIHSSLSQ